MEDVFPRPFQRLPGQTAPGDAESQNLLNVMDRQFRSIKPHKKLSLADSVYKLHADGEAMETVSEVLEGSMAFNDCLRLSVHRLDVSHAVAYAAMRLCD
jgi:hypothetical protein